MGVVDEIFSALRKGNDLANDINDIAKLNPQSLSKRAADSTFQFPCLIGNDIPISMASVIVRNMDRVYASFVQPVVASDPLIDISVDRSPLDYMKRLHQNMKLESVIFESALYNKDEEMDEIREILTQECPDLLIPEEEERTLLEKCYNGEYQLFLDPTGTYGVAFSESNVTKEVLESNKEGLKEYLSQWDLKPFNAFEAPSDRNRVATEILQGAVDAARREQNKGTLSATDKMNGSVKLLDRDVKKSNDIQPYAVQVRLMAVNSHKEFVQYIDFIIGVKTVMHACSAKEITDNIIYVLKNKNPLFNFVRWTTGEISLFKDLILHLDEIKYDVNYKNRGNTSFIPTLKRLKAQKVGLQRLKPTKLLPNSTIVVSSFTADEIKSTTGVDIRDVYFAKKIISELFLMTFIIVDEGTETIDILYEGASSFETYALETLEREVNLSSNKLGKEIGRMISQ